MSTKNHQGTTRRYSDAFKRQVVESVEQEGYTQAEAANLYGCAQESVRRWIKQFGKNHLLNKVVKIQTMDETSRIKELTDQVSQLKEALADAHLDQKMAQTWLELACQQLDESPEEFKKKHDINSSKS